eukprot:1156970-Pelagomonas_calceolata.AAC.3
MNQADVLGLAKFVSACLECSAHAGRYSYVTLPFPSLATVLGRHAGAAPNTYEPELTAREQWLQQQLVAKGSGPCSIATQLDAVEVCEALLDLKVEMRHTLGLVSQMLCCETIAQGGLWATQRGCSPPPPDQHGCSPPPPHQHDCSPPHTSFKPSWLLTATTQRGCAAEIGVGLRGIVGLRFKAWFGSLLSLDDFEG